MGDGCCWQLEALGVVEDDGVIGTVVSCCLLDAEVGSMVELVGSGGGRGSRCCWLEIPLVDG